MLTRLCRRIIWTALPNRSPSRLTRTWQLPFTYEQNGSERTFGRGLFCVTLDAFCVVWWNVSLLNKAHDPRSNTKPTRSNTNQIETLILDATNSYPNGPVIPNFRSSTSCRVMMPTMRPYSSTNTAGLLCKRRVTSCALASTSTVGKLASITSLTGESSRCRFRTTQCHAGSSRKEQSFKLA